MNHSEMTHSELLSFVRSLSEQLLKPYDNGRDAALDILCNGVGILLRDLVDRMEMEEKQARCLATWNTSIKDRERY